MNQIALREPDFTPLKADGCRDMMLCREYLERFPALVAPAGNEVAIKLAKVLIGSYPGREVHDPETFSRAITSVLAEVPPDIGKMAVDRLTRRLKFLPTRADVCEETEKLLIERRAMKTRAEAALKKMEEEKREREYAEKVARERKDREPFNPDNLTKAVSRGTPTRAA